MGTYYRVSLVAHDRIDESQIQNLIDTALDRINQQMSTYLPDSEISRFNHSASLNWTSVSAELAQVIAKAKQIHHQSAGRFDPTLGPAINLWKFGEADKPTQIPSAEQLANINKEIGADKLDIRLQPAAIRKHWPGLTLNLSAIAKGFAVDQLAEIFESMNIHNYLVDIGGEIRARGSNHKGQAWQIGIEKPIAAAAQQVQQIISIGDNSIATSGSYRNFYEEDGIRYSHIIDPLTLAPIKHKLLSVSVIAEDCMTADGYATTLMVLGPKLGYQFALQYGLAVYMIEKDGDEYIVKFTPQMKAFMN